VGDEEAAVHLALEGQMAQVLLDLPQGGRGSFEGLTPALERRFGQRLSTEESILLSAGWGLLPGITAWFSSSTAADRKAL